MLDFALDNIISEWLEAKDVGINFRTEGLKHAIFYYRDIDDVRSEKFYIDTLEEIGLGAPQVTYLMRELKRRGFNVSEEVFTVEQGKEELLKILLNEKKNNMGEK